MKRTTLPRHSVLAPRLVLALGLATACLAPALPAVADEPAVAASTTTLSGYDTAVLADDPAVYWTMSGSGSGAETDLGSAGIDGTYTGSPTVATLPNGDAAVDFDGATQYFEAPDADALSPATTGVITIEAWMRPDVLQFPNEEGSGYVHWMGKGEAGQHEYVARMYSLDNTETRPNRISGYSFNLSGGLGAGSYFQDAVQPGQWIHYVLVINANAKSAAYPNGYTKVYRDGVLRDQDDLSIRGQIIVPERGSAPFRAGTRDFASWFDGAVGKIAVWDSELSAAQIAAHTAAM
ncbi:LamG domain-containing protein [Cnuibacter physcomitrellae]|uniref:LamG domain-containing protein n=1 Tax=Cnuibacter physcomitrellae TaxID=1619308 RepID=UPI0021761480|nr:LamG domain-containing protein [Cnuibacter physcomitrellae]MCS5497254.1 LamG domain-containing protein [Cnuibacter physcomitrellae]